MDEAAGASLRILPEGTVSAVAKGTSLRRALLSAGVPVRGNCGGHGTCGQCRVRVDGQWVLACDYAVEHSVTVFVPVSSRVPLSNRVPVSRHVTPGRSQVSGARPRSRVRSPMPETSQAGPETDVALAVDIGTTTLSLSLVRAGPVDDSCQPGNRRALATRSVFNPQVAFGDDVITRINYAQQNPTGLAEMRHAVVEEINHLTISLLDGLPNGRIVRAVVSGNTTMLRILLGLDLEPVRHDSLGDWATRAHSSSAAALGLDLGGDLPALVFPVVAGWVGGDVVAGILSSGMSEHPEVRLLVDLGTNGEMVLGCRDWLVAFSCSAGPAFEGGGITWGMPAGPGAIDAVSVDPQTMTVQCSVIGQRDPEGICGSGLISALRSMLAAGIIDRSGRFRGAGRAAGGPEAPGRLRLATSNWGEEITIWDRDVLTAMRAKAAVYAGMKTLEEELGTRLDSLAEVLVAGGFGSSIDIESAVAIGLLPDLPRSRFRVIGNSSLQGAAACARSPGTLSQAEEIARRVTYLDLVGHPRFLDQFVKAMFLPHTDLKEFPSQRDRYPGR